MWAHGQYSPRRIFWLLMIGESDQTEYLLAVRTTRIYRSGLLQSSTVRYRFVKLVQYSIDVRDLEYSSENEGCARWHRLLVGVDYGAVDIIVVSRLEWSEAFKY